MDNATDMVDDVPLDRRTLLSRVNNSVDINRIRTYILGSLAHNGLTT